MQEPRTKDHDSSRGIEKRLVAKLVALAGPGAAPSPKLVDFAAPHSHSPHIITAHMIGSGPCTVPTYADQTYVDSWA